MSSCVVAVALLSSSYETRPLTFAAFAGTAHTGSDAFIVVTMIVPSAAISARPESILERGMEGCATGGPMAGLSTDSASRSRVHSILL